MNDPENESMTVTTEDQRALELSAVERALVEQIGQAPDPRPSTVIPVVAQQCPGADVRGAYWKLIGRSVVVRQLNGRLTVKHG